MGEDFAVPKGYACTITVIEGGYLAELQRCEFWSRHPYGPIFAAKDTTRKGAVEGAVHRLRASVR